MKKRGKRVLEMKGEQGGARRDAGHPVAGCPVAVCPVGHTALPFPREESPLRAFRCYQDDEGKFLKPFSLLALGWYQVIGVTQTQQADPQRLGMEQNHLSGDSMVKMLLAVGTGAAPLHSCLLCTNGRSHGFGAGQSCRSRDHLTPCFFRPW